MNKFFKRLFILTLINCTIHSNSAVAQSMDEIQIAIQIGIVTVKDLTDILANKREFPVKISTKNGKVYQGVIISTKLENNQIQIAQDTGEVTSLDKDQIDTISVPSNMKYLMLLRPNIIPYNVEAPTQLEIKRAANTNFGKFKLESELVDKNLTNGCRASLNYLFPKIADALKIVSEDGEGKKKLDSIKKLTFAGNSADLRIAKEGDVLAVKYSCGFYTDQKEIEKSILANF